MKLKRRVDRLFAICNGYLYRKVYGLPYYELVAARKFGRFKTKTQHKRANCLSPRVFQ